MLPLKFDPSMMSAAAAAAHGRAAALEPPLSIISLSLGLPAA